MFEVEPRVLIDNGASRTHTVLELNGRDRPGLLYEVTKTLKDLGMVISSAHISTYGERVVDVFYVKDVFGLKITQPGKMRQIQRRLTTRRSPAGAPARRRGADRDPPAVAAEPAPGAAARRAAKSGSRARSPPSGR